MISVSFIVVSANMIVDTSFIGEDCDVIEGCGSSNSQKQRHGQTFSFDVFCHVRFPNLAVCNITRDSIRAALSMGITADQVNNLKFYSLHSRTIVIHLISQSFFLLIPGLVLCVICVMHNHLCVTPLVSLLNFSGMTFL